MRGRGVKVDRLYSVGEAKSSREIVRRLGSRCAGMLKAQCIDLLQQRLSGVFTDEGRLNSQVFQPRSTDVFVAGSPRSGTTWLQQIVHQLRTGGDVEFGEIGEVVPLLEFAHDLKQDLEAEQSAFPRCFKTHYWYPRCPKGARYIWCVREPCAVAYSFFKLFEGWIFQPEEVSVEDFVGGLWLPVTVGPPNLAEHLHASYFHHLASWWPHRNDSNVLLLFYEDLKECYENSVHSVAEFMGITDEGHIQIALERSTFEFMKQHSDRFGVKNIQKYRNSSLGISETAGLGKSKVRTGSATEGQKMLSAELCSEIQKTWEIIVTPVTGCATYPELRVAWKNEKEALLSTAK